MSREGESEMICGKNRALCGFLAASLFITLASGICADEAARQQRSIPGYVLGDLDGDSEVSWDDDTLFKEYFAGIETEMQYITFRKYYEAEKYFAIYFATGEIVIFNGNCKKDKIKEIICGYIENVKAGE